MISMFSSSKTSLAIIAIVLSLLYQYMSSTPTPSQTHSMNTVKNAMTNLAHAKIVPRYSAQRGTADHGWLDTKHTFSFASYYDPQHESFGSLRVLNEDRVAPGTGFPTHHHRDAEIFSYILSGELTHRDSMIKQGAESNDKDKFFRMHRGDVQFTTGGSGISHSEQNEHGKDWVHFLQIWALPWRRGLPPIYHTQTFTEGDKRKGFVQIISPLKAGLNASAADEKAAVPMTPGTIPVHADLLFSAGIIPKGATFEYKVGGDGAVKEKTNRKVYVHFPQCKGRKAQLKLNDSQTLDEGDGAYVTGVNAGDVLTFESAGSEEAEVVVLDSNSN